MRCSSALPLNNEHQRYLLKVKMKSIFKTVHPTEYSRIIKLRKSAKSKREQARICKQIINRAKDRYHIETDPVKKNTLWQTVIQGMLKSNRFTTGADYDLANANLQTYLLSVKDEDQMSTLPQSMLSQKTSQPWKQPFHEESVREVFPYKDIFDECLLEKVNGEDRSPMQHMIKTTESFAEKRRRLDETDLFLKKTLPRRWQKKQQQRWQAYKLYNNEACERDWQQISYYNDRNAANYKNVSKTRLVIVQCCYYMLIGCTLVWKDSIPSDVSCSNACVFVCDLFDVYGLFLNIIEQSEAWRNTS